MSRAIQAILSGNAEAGVAKRFVIVPEKSMDRLKENLAGLGQSLQAINGADVSEEIARVAEKITEPQRRLKRGLSIEEAVFLEDLAAQAQRKALGRLYLMGLPEEDAEKPHLDKVKPADYDACMSIYKYSNAVQNMLDGIIPSEREAPKPVRRL